MTSTIRALNQFFSGFGIPAYAKNNIPDRVTMPYLTYEIVSPDPMSEAMFHAWLFYPGNKYTAMAAKVDEIEAALREGGASVRTDSGVVRLFTDDHTPFAQEQPDPDSSLRVMYLTMILHAMTY